MCPHLFSGTPQKSARIRVVVMRGHFIGLVGELSWITHCHKPALFRTKSAALLQCVDEIPFG